MFKIKRFCFCKNNTVGTAGIRACGDMNNVSCSAQEASSFMGVWFTINKDKIARYLVKTYFSIVGWYRCNFVFTNALKHPTTNEIIIAKALNEKSNTATAYQYLGEKIFFKTTQIMEPTTGVILTDSSKIKLEYWKIKALDLQIR